MSLYSVRSPRTDQLDALFARVKDIAKGAALMTGKYPARLHITDWITGHVKPYAKLKVPDWQMHLPLEERTIAEALKPSADDGRQKRKNGRTNGANRAEHLCPHRDV